MRSDILSKIEEALSSIDIHSGDFDIQEYDEFVGIKDEVEVTHWTRDEWDIRSQSNSLDRMDNRTTIRIHVRVSTDPEHFAGKPKEEPR